MVVVFSKREYGKWKHVNIILEERGEKCDNGMNQTKGLHGNVTTKPPHTTLMYY
jgi:hypothetical protein